MCRSGKVEPHLTFLVEIATLFRQVRFAYRALRVGRVRCVNSVYCPDFNKIRSRARVLRIRFKYPNR